MDEIVKFIIEQINNLRDYKNSRPKSVIIFGMQKNEMIELYNQVSYSFNTIRRQLEEERYLERKVLFEKFSKNDIDKYDELKDRYIGTEKIDYICDLERQVFDESQNTIEQYDTELKEFLDKFDLVKLDIYEYHNKRKRKAFLDDTLDFSRLLKYNESKDKYLYSKLTDEEREYLDLLDFVIKQNYPKYAFIHNFYESEKTEWSLIELMRHNLKWDHLKWSVICIEPNNEFWEKDKSDELKFEVYYNRKVFDLAKKITPIENRLKIELDNAGISYEFQHPVGKYILDFHIQNNQIKLDVECDGKEFHSEFEAKNHDNERDLFMQKKGYKVLRLPGVLIWNSPKFCVEKIQKLLNE